MKKLLLITLALFQLTVAQSSPLRYERTINSRWEFHKDGDMVTEIVNLPHTWNALDCQDEVPGFWRGIAWYEKSVAINDRLDGRKIFVRFEGAYQETELFVNGQSAGKHVGGFTAFIFDVTELVHNGTNQFRIKVDNSHNESIPPMSADFTFFGGIYRDVSLLFVPESHICVSHYASSGVYISTPEVSAERAAISIRTLLSPAPDAERISVEHIIISPDGQQIATVARKIRKPSSNVPDTQTVIIDTPQLWDIDSPRLYSVVTQLKDRNGDLIDEVRNTFGIRTFSFDSEKGFFLNGRHIKLIGTNRHQDYKDLGNALPDEMHERDVLLLKEMGGNFLRIAHYPQDPVVTQICDRLGIVNSVEIPIVNRVTPTPEFTANCVEMAREMVYQGYNNPSTIIWAYMNEVAMNSPWLTEGAGLSKEEYFAALCDCASQIDHAIKEADPSRSTMLPCHNAAKRYLDSGVTRIPDILGFNLYCGWYTLGLETFAPTLDKIHAMFPGKPLLLTEYGADMDPRLHSFSPERMDYTCDYGLMYHRAHIPVILEKSYLAGSNVWNINDFYSEVRGFAVPHVNLKGLTGLDRTPKDTYWLYKAWLSKEPFLRIGGHDWIIRGGQLTGDICKQSVTVFSNSQSVELFLNGRRLGTKEVKERTADFDVPFTNGWNILTAKGSDGAEDMLRIDFRGIPEDLSNFTELNVMLGSKRYFEDRPGGQVWLPEKEYTTGSWGYIGGFGLCPKTANGNVPCSDKDIIGTDRNPIFQTQRAGLEAFKADVPDGKYYVYLYFAELMRQSNGKAVPYYLGSDVISEDQGKRVFDVTICGSTVLKDFDIEAENGINTAVIKKFTVDVKDGAGLDIRFIPITGIPVLNAVRIYRAF